tara:strand:- start:5327 stop:7288 length:1962 start_codon:yes stop_codon:yes gene_type:complete
MSVFKKLAAAPAAGEGVNVESIFSSTLYRATDNGNATFVNSGTDLSTNGGMIWFKCRSSAFSHALCDTVTGIQNNLVPNATDALDTNGDGLGRRVCQSVQTNGFTYGTGHTGSNGTSGGKYCAWSFAKQSNFFDCLTYTGDGSTGRAISHSLGSAPGMVMIKNLTRASDWHIWHRGLSGTNYGVTLNQTYSEFTNGGILTATPTSTTVTIKNPGYDGAGTNNNGDSYVMYLFAHNNSDGGFGTTGDQDIIKCGNFTTNGSGIADVTLGFEPQWILVRKVNETMDWEMFDMMRGWVHNTHQDNMDYMLRANLSNTEYNSFDTRGHPTSTGFQYQYTGNDTYIYMAIRRPMAAAETGADVFKGTYGNASGNQPPGWSTPTGFRVDAAIDLNVGGGSTDAPTFGARQIQGRYTDRLYETSGPQFYTWSGHNFQYQNGFRDSSNGTGDLGYFWQRKPTGFDTFCFTGTGSNMTHTHNLGGEVGMAWWFTVSTTTHVYVYARPLGANKYLRLNLNSASSTDTLLWQNTHPTDTNFYTGGGYNNTNQDHIMLLFGNASGISKVGTFTGNGTNQNIDCGFSNGIRLLMIKKTNSTGNWYFWDEANLTASNQPFWYIQYAAGLIQNQDTIDTYSAGFNIKFNTYQSINTNGDTYLFYAVAA